MPITRRRAAENSKTDYEREQDSRISELNRRLEELGINKLAATVKSFAKESGTPRNKRAGKRGRTVEGTNDSEYLPEAEEQVQGDTDDDASLDEETKSLGEDPVPLTIIEPPRKQPRRKVISSRPRTRSQGMAPGGTRQSRRVRPAAPNEPATQDGPGQARVAAALNEAPTEEGQAQAKRIRFAAPVGRPLGVTTRSSTRQQDTEADEVAQEDLPPESQDGDGVHSPRHYEWSYPTDYVQDGEEENREYGENAEEEHPDEQTQTGGQDSAQTAPRRHRPPTRGILLTKMVRAMKGRLPISVEEGKKRPHEPVQAAKLASEAGIIVRNQVPILTHWKEYNKNGNGKHFDEFCGKLSGRLAINTTDDGPAKEACASVFQSGIRQTRYKLKQKYFNGVPVDQIRTTSPVAYMTDVQWLALVDKWKTPKNLETAQKNKQNRAKVKFHQATGSRCYVAQLHAYTEKKKAAQRASQAAARAHREDDADGLLEDIVHAPQEDLEDAPDVELDALEVFKECHTSRIKGLSDVAKEAIEQMENMKAQAEGDAESSVQAVYRVLAQNTKKTTFLKNVGMQPTSPAKSETCKERALQEQLAAERRSSAALNQEVDVLKEKSQLTEQALEKTQMELQEYKRSLEEQKKALDENNALLNRLLMLGRGNPPV